MNIGNVKYCRGDVVYCRGKECRVLGHGYHPQLGILYHLRQCESLILLTDIQESKLRPSIEKDNFKVENCEIGRAVQIPFSTLSKPKCTCGSTIAKTIGHSDWCDIKE